jgi:hypothetical protein
LAAFRRLLSIGIELGPRIGGEKGPCRFSRINPRQARDFAKAMGVYLLNPVGA